MVKLLKCQSQSERIKRQILLMSPRCVVNSTKIMAVSAQTQRQYCSRNCIIRGKAAEFIVDCRQIVHYVTVVRAYRYIRPAAASAAAAIFVMVTR